MYESSFILNVLTTNLNYLLIIFFKPKMGSVPFLLLGMVLGMTVEWETSH